MRSAFRALAMVKASRLLEQRESKILHALNRGSAENTAPSLGGGDREGGWP